MESLCTFIGRQLNVPIFLPIQPCSDIKDSIYCFKSNFHIYYFGTILIAGLEFNINYQAIFVYLFNGMENHFSIFSHWNFMKAKNKYQVKVCCFYHLSAYFVFYNLDFDCNYLYYLYLILILTIFCDVILIQVLQNFLYSNFFFIGWFFFIAFLYFFYKNCYLFMSKIFFHLKIEFNYFHWFFLSSKHLDQEHFKFIA